MPEKTKVYLMPVCMRRGADVVVYVTQEDENSYWMGVYSGYNTRLKKGTGYGKDYNNCQRSRISKQFYEQSVAEAGRLKKRYKKGYDAEAERQNLKVVAETIINRQPRHPLGHGFLWVTFKNEKFLAASIDGRENHNKIIDEVTAIDGVTNAYINLD